MKKNLVVIILFFGILSSAEAPRSFRIIPNSPLVGGVISERLERIREIQKVLDLDDGCATVVMFMRMVEDKQSDLIAKRIEETNTLLNLESDQNFRAHAGKVYLDRDVTEAEAFFIAIQHHYSPTQKVELAVVQHEINQLLEDIINSTQKK